MSWSLDKVALKKYPHFDAWLSAKEAVALATNPGSVSSHPFYPFMRYVQGWTRFADPGEKGERKKRPIRYAARGDAYIFSYYRSLLATPYEAELKLHGLSQSVLAYRRITDKTGGGKCNIHFARDAFLQIQKAGNCCVVALDISSFFEKLDHQKLYALWCRMLGLKKLPPDHLHVFRTVTRYAVVDKKAAYEKLGHFGVKRITPSGKKIPGYLTPYKKMPTQICDGETFRKLIAGGDGNPSLIKFNHKPYGIPQGSPISDLLANLYLLDFDKAMLAFATSEGGVYFRYSDDILIIVPGDGTRGLKLRQEAQDLIKAAGSKLRIKDRKSSIFEFKMLGGRQVCKLVDGTQGKNGLEYLGFRFDGRHAYIRDSTLSNLYRKVSRNAYREAHVLIRRYPGKTEAQLRSLYNIEDLVQRFGRAEDYDGDDYRKWTFWTYAKRASAIFGPLGRPILKQLKKHRDHTKASFDYALTKILS